MEAQGEKLLQRLADEEVRQLAKVEEAKQEATSIVEEAQRKAAEILAQAQTRADAASKERRDGAERESTSARDEVLAQAGRDVSGVEKTASAKQGDAVKWVLEQVLP